MVAVFGQMFGEFLVGNNAGLGESVHSFSNLDVDVSVYDEIHEVVLIDDFLGD